MPPQTEGPVGVFKRQMDALRTGIAAIVNTCADVKAQLASTFPKDTEGADVGEMIANVTLALRHFEDAAMRLGKAIQASSGGKSPLGGPNTPGTKL
jgi:hypothetical protein